MSFANITKNIEIWQFQPCNISAMSKMYNSAYHFAFHGNLQIKATTLPALYGKPK